MAVILLSFLRWFRCVTTKSNKFTIIISCVHICGSTSPILWATPSPFCRCPRRHRCCHRHHRNNNIIIISNTLNFHIFVIMHSITTSAAEVVISLIKSYEANYPEILKCCYIINGMHDKRLCYLKLEKKRIIRDTKTLLH